jgi:hypothetical protein
MIDVRSAPRFWFWSHDIQPNQVAGLDMPGMRLRRLANYRRGREATRRFAALYHDDDGALAPSHTWLIDVDAASAAVQGSRAASITVDVAPENGKVSFTLVLEAQPHPGRAVHADLTSDELTELLDGTQAVVDFATYLRDGSRCLAVIVEPTEAGGSMFFPALSPGEVRSTLGPRSVVPTKARAFNIGPAGWRVAVIGEHVRGTSWSVLVDIDADDVSEKLEHLQAYPLDLDAVGHGMSVRFAVVAAKLSGGASGRVSQFRCDRTQLLSRCERLREADPRVGDPSGGVHP